MQADTQETLDGTRLASALARASQAEKDALITKLYLDYSRALKGFIGKLLHHQDSERRDELLSETWLHIVQGLSSYNGATAKFYSWACRIALNVYLGDVRREKADFRIPKEVVLSLDQPLETGSTRLLPVENNLEELLIGEEARQQFIQAISTLPAHRKKVIESALNGESPREYSRTKGIPYGSISTARRRGFKQLRNFQGLEGAGSLEAVVTASYVPRLPVVTLERVSDVTSTDS